MSIDDQRRERRLVDLCANDPQFAAAVPDQAISAAIDEPRLRLPEIVRMVMAGYADRPALGARAIELISDPSTGRTGVELLPRFDTVSYGELWDRISALARDLAAGPSPAVRAGDKVGIVGFASVDYTVVDLAMVELGAVVVPMHTGTPVTQLRPIVAETEPILIAASIGDTADAVDLMLTGSAATRLLVFDYHPDVDDHREALAAAAVRLAEGGAAYIAQLHIDHRPSVARLKHGRVVVADLVQ